MSVTNKNRLTLGEIAAKVKMGTVFFGSQIRRSYAPFRQVQLHRSFSSVLPSHNLQFLCRASGQNNDGTRPHRRCRTDRPVVFASWRHGSWVHCSLGPPTGVSSPIDISIGSAVFGSQSRQSDTDGQAHCSP